MESLTTSHFSEDAHLWGCGPWGTVSPVSATHHRGTFLELLPLSVAGSPASHPSFWISVRECEKCKRLNTWTGCDVPTGVLTEAITTVRHSEHLSLESWLSLQRKILYHRGSEGPTGPCQAPWSAVGPTGDPQAPGMHVPLGTRPSSRRTAWEPRTEAVRAAPSRWLSRALFQGRVSVLCGVCPRAPRARGMWLLGHVLLKFVASSAGER